MTKDFFCKKAKTKEELDIALKIRYKAYLGVNYFPKQEDERYYDYFDLKGISENFLLYRSQVPIASLRVILDSSHGLPMDERGFSEYIQSFREKGRKICEFGKICSKPEYSLTRSEVLLLIKASCKFAQCQKSQDIVSIAQPKIANLWVKLFGFQKLTDQVIKKEGYPLMIPVRLNLETFEENLHKIYKGRATKNLHKYYLSDGF